MEETRPRSNSSGHLSIPTQQFKRNTNTVNRPKKSRAPLPPGSHKHRCKENTVYCIFIGQAGCGKSKTINFFFGDKEISPIERESGTEEILEFSAVLSKSKNEKMVIVDTPGLGDMNSLDWDGKVIKSIEMFMKNHEQLKDSFPNAVLLFGRFDDNRMDGESSNFVKMLKAVYSIQSSLIDPKKNNLIIVLTHYMNGKKAMRQDPTPKIQLVLNLVKLHLKLNSIPTVVLAENEALDWQLEEKEQGSYSLKNKDGDIYPDNIYNSILQVCEKSVDPIGAKLITKVWVNRLKITASTFKMESHPMVSDIDSEMVTATLAHTYNTSVSQLRDTLNVRWNKLGKSIEDPDYQKLLENLEKKNIVDKKGLQKEPDQWIEFLQSLSIGNVALINLLESVGCPTKNYDIKKSIGSGWYSLFDNFANSNPVLFGPLSFQTSILPHRLPANVTCQLLSDFVGKSTTTKLMKLVKSSTSSQSEGQKSSVKYSKAASSISFKSGSSNTEFYTGKWEIPVAVLKITGNVENLPVNPNFKRAAQQLKPFVKSDRLSWNHWRVFFNEWGSHIVTSANIGGLYSVKISRKELSKLKKSAVGNDEAFLGALGDFDRGFKLLVKDKFQYELAFSGGMPMERMEIVYPPNQEQIDNFKAWRSSIRMNPICLKEGIGIVPLKELIPELREASLNYDEACRILLVMKDGNEKSGTSMANFTNMLSNFKIGGIFKKAKPQSPITSVGFSHLEKLD